jgi:hypothetical protein
MTPWQPGDDLAAWLAEASARQAALAAASAARSEGLIAECRVRLSQVECARCYGDLGAATVAGWYAAIGTAPCTCEVRCPRPSCTATWGLTWDGT